MANDFDDMLGTDDGYPKPKRKFQPIMIKTELHRVLTRGLPDFVNDEGVLQVHRKNYDDLAKKMGVSHQAIYGWLKRNRISRKRMETVIHLSESTVKIPAPVDGVEWKPLTKEDLWNFVS